MGYMPEVHHCLSCGRDDNIMYFSPLKGGVLCRDCKSSVDDIFYIKRETLNTLRYLLSNGFGNVVKLRIQKDVLVELDKIVTDYMSVHFDKNFQSKYFLDKLKNM
jgi:DNA repair protein RecO (recombination protein O)